MTKHNIPTSANPKGFYENFAFMKIHDALLKYNNSTWSNVTKNKMEYIREHIAQYRLLIDKEFKNTQKILIKDPRIVFFSFFIEEVCAGLYKYNVIFCTRNVNECCQSLIKATDIDLETANILYNKSHLFFNKFDSSKRIQVDYKDIMYVNKIVMQRISSFCNFPILRNTGTKRRPLSSNFNYRSFRFNRRLIYRD